MKKFSEQFNKEAKDIRLSPLEKFDLKERVATYMEYHPLPYDLKTVSSLKTTDGQQIFFSNIGKWRIARWSSAFMLLLLVFVAYSAEKAVPGDTLYAMKVDFNEELRSSVTLGSYKKVVWETERLNRRIAEARLLADEGRLTGEAEVRVVSAVKKHTENARKEIANLKLSDEDEATLASIGLNTALELQTNSFNLKLDEGREGISSTRLIQEFLTETQTDDSTTQNILPAYNRILAKVESETTRAYELLKNINSTAKEIEAKDIADRLLEIENKVKAAMASSESEEEQAKRDLIVALQQTQRLIAFMTNIDIRHNLTIKDLVPNIYPEAVRITVVKNQVRETEALLKNIELKLNESPIASSTVTLDLQTKEKLILDLDQSKIVLKQTKVLLEEGADVQVLEKSSLEAHSLVTDISVKLKLPTIELKLEEIKHENNKGTSTENEVR